MAERDVFSGLEWRREGGVMQTVLQSMNSLRVPLVHNTLLGLPAEAPPTYHAPLPLTGYSVLDVGCGAGYLTEVSPPPPTLSLSLVSLSHTHTHTHTQLQFMSLSLAACSTGCKGHWTGAL